MPNPRIRVLLVDDHAVVRGGLRFYLADADDIEIVGEAASGKEAIALVATLLPDIVVMDVMMPEMDGIAAMREVRELFPQVRVIALTSFAEGELVQRALQAGAIGYLLKDTQARELSAAIRTAVTGSPVLSDDATRALVRALGAPPTPGGDLSERELEVLRLLVDGLSNELIADKLFISRNTVRHHIHNILAKLNAVNRTEAVGLALKHNLVDQQ